MLHTFNRILEKLMPFITPASVIAGIIFSAYLKDFTFLVSWLFALMTFEGSLNIQINSLKNVILHPVPVFLIFAFLHIVMPLWAWGIGHIAFTDDPLTVTGIIIGMIIPAGITSFLWVSMKNGNKMLTLAIILIDALLSPIVIPFSLSLLVGQVVQIDTGAMMTNLFYVIVIPSILGIFLNYISNGKLNNRLKPILSPVSKISLGVIVMLNGAVVTPYFINFNLKLLYIMLIVFVIAFSGYLFAYLFARWMKYDKEQIITFTFCGGMRNITTGAVIALTYFPPAVILPIVASMLFQQLLASIFGTILDKTNLPAVENKKSIA